MSATVAVLTDTIRVNWRRFALWGIVTALAFQVVMMAALISRFTALPNYVTFYNWPGSVWTIIKSTPSWGDVWPIIAEEWLIEIGRMNYDYGLGISEWSLNVVPSRMVVLFVLGALIALALHLMKRETCSRATAKGASVAAGVGTVLVAMTNATMSWVVCCATPSWVVGLAMLGLGVSTSLALERLGGWLSGAGFGILIAMILVLAWRKANPHQASLPRGTHAGRA